MKLLASDLDGTLLLKGEKKLNSRIFEALKRVKDAGMSLCIASGRTYGELLRHFEGLEKDIYFIASDGALVVQNGVNLYGTRFSEEDLALINRLDEFVLHGKYMAYIKSDYPYFIRKIKAQYGGHAVVIKDVSEIKDCTFKLVLYKNYRTLKKLPFDMIYKDNNLCEFVKSGVNKGKALKSLTDDLGTDKKDCVAFGDSDNDKEFLQAVEHSYAVNNAKYEIRKICKNYTCDVEKTIDLIIKEAAK